jgi:hypothetical protein
MFDTTSETLLRTIVRAQEGSDYIDAEGYWESGNHAGAAVAHGLEARGYVLVKRHFLSGDVIGVKPTIRGFRYERRWRRRSEDAWLMDLDPEPAPEPAPAPEPEPESDLDEDGYPRKPAPWELEVPEDTPDLMDSAPIEYWTER